MWLTLFISKLTLLFVSLSCSSAKSPFEAACLGRETGKNLGIRLELVPCEEVGFQDEEPELGERAATEAVDLFW